MMREEKSAYWRQRVEAFQASGGALKNDCAQEGIAVAALHCRRKRFAGDSETQTRSKDTADFLPITIAPVRSSGAAVEIHLLSGRHLKLTAPVKLAWLRTLVQVLEGSCG
ncbi:IS66 family insertion sequence element accessory protein TnpA [Acidithiobacillus sulfuriphilus]|uniref:IS66 family insertion sequence element accessory protein TnpB n=2 Tax=Acidithiobacillus sulfuriphilus TaxID=1867749 RepID=A0A3M8S087_9PROT|nr:hypothetical protein [Acidithiobacillus sulfuriphilus]RNF74178.1 IS66 family insertion sequence hypothetical protein [Acidithiobacillus sulfuriphilus]